MYDRNKHLKLLADLNAAVQEYHKFIPTEPLKPGETPEPTDIKALQKAHIKLENAEAAESEYWNRFIDENGHINFNLN